MRKKTKRRESLAGKCCLCGAKIANKNDKACKKCQDECEKSGHGGNGKYIVQIMFGCFCTRCGKSYMDF